MGHFVITIRTNGEFQFNLNANNGLTILTSQGYTTKAACHNGIESVRTNSQVAERFDSKDSSNDKAYFNILAGNGQIIGTSQMYESSAGRDNGIKSVMENAPTAEIKDTTTT